MNQIRHDMSKKLQQELAAVLERETDIAGLVLGASDVAVMMIEAAVMMTRTAAATAANSVNDLSKVEEIFDATIEVIVSGARGSRQDSLARVHTARKAWTR